jgi:hypothetical protein
MEPGLTEDDLRRIRQFVETPERFRSPDLLLPDTTSLDRRQARRAPDRSTDE